MTVGALVNQIWSVAGNANRSDVSQMFVQPFMSYNRKSGAGLAINSEITQNWTASSTSVFINTIITAVTKVGTQIVSLGIGPRIQVAASDGNKADLGVRAAVTFIFPK